MIPFKTPLEAIVDHPSRPLLIITLTFAIALLALWPAVDDYLQLDTQVQELQHKLLLAEAETDGYASLVENKKQIEITIEPYLKNNVDEGRANEIRRELVKAVRETDCTLRNIDLGDVIIRKLDNNHLLVNKSEKKDSPFRLESRELRLRVDGSYYELHEFLKRFDQINSYIDDYDVKLKSNDATGENLQLEIKMRLLGLKYYEEELKDA
ncbi:MAG: hypothetical protein COA78_26150 [Blastopirellula sp.]|nr:MAG: hypothetical protein COA78_26150 [Blastopirellula sp.]